jgi:hypothetical protein
VLRLAKPFIQDRLISQNYNRQVVYVRSHGRECFQYLPEISSHTREETFSQRRAESYELAWLQYCLAARITPPDEEKYPSSQPLTPRKPVRPDSSVLNCTLDTRNFGHEFSECQPESMVILISH